MPNGRFTLLHALHLSTSLWINRGDLKAVVNYLASQPPLRPLVPVIKRDAVLTGDRYIRANMCCTCTYTEYVVSCVYMWSLCIHLYCTCIRVKANRETEGEGEREKSRKRLTSPVIMVVGNGGSSLVYATSRKVVAAATGVADGVSVDLGKWPALKAIPELRRALSPRALVHRENVVFGLSIWLFVFYWRTT